MGLRANDHAVEAIRESGGVGVHQLEISVGSADRGERDPGFEIGRSLKGVTDAGICAYAQTELSVGKAERGQRDRGEPGHNYTKCRAVTQREIGRASCRERV